MTIGVQCDILECDSFFVSSYAHTSLYKLYYYVVRRRWSRTSDCHFKAKKQGYELHEWLYRRHCNGYNGCTSLQA